MSFNQFMVILRARWLIAVGIFFAVVILGAFASVIWPKQYTATASIVVDSKTDPVTAANGAAAGGGQPVATYVNTQADIIASERVAQRVVKTLKLDQQPEARKLWAKGPNDDISVTVANLLLERKLLVAPAHDSPTHSSNVIDISVKWSDPVTAAALANGFAQAAIETNIELKVEPAKQYASWFEQRSRALRADLAEKQKKLSDFQSKNGIVATDEKLDVENARLTELSTELVNIQGMRQESQARQHRVGTDISTLPEVLQSPVIQSLKAALSQAEAKKPDVAARLGKNHPDYQAVEGEITNLRTRIAQESANIAASLGSTTQTNLRREDSVRQALEAQKQRVLELKYQHDQAAMYLNDVTAAQRDLDEVSQRLAQSNLESLTQQTNVVQLSTASAPESPSSPKLVINLIVAIFLGGVIGIGSALAAEMRDRRVREDEDIVELLGVPLLGKLDVVRVRANDVRVAQAAAGRLEPSVI
ncbi:MAG TPA: chain length determinant protein EpsF [Steroidobacteraceae bacterium]|jgi:chain length determinant protein EpsF|nr:chain length determinant protein EpsF [Steroidobacteraceae bacterium]